VVFLEVLEYFTDMVMMEIGIVGVDEEVTKNVVHESLKCSWRISESEKHNTPFKGALVGPECGFPFIAFADSDKMIGMLEVNVGEQSCFMWTVQEIGDPG